MTDEHQDLSKLTKWLKVGLALLVLDQFVMVSWARLLSSLIDLPLIAVVWILVSTMQQWQAARMQGKETDSPAMVA